MVVVSSRALSQTVNTEKNWQAYFQFVVRDALSLLLSGKHACLFPFHCCFFDVSAVFN